MNTCKRTALEKLFSHISFSATLLLVCLQVAACKNFDTDCSPADAQCDGLGVWLAYQSVTPILVVGDSLGQVHVSYDGLSWQTVTINASRTLKDMTYANGLFWAVTGNAIADGKVFYSADAITWQNTTAGIANAAPMSGIAFGNGLYVVTAEIGGAGNFAYSSADGINWTPNTDAQLTGIDFAGVNLLNFTGGIFVAGEVNGDNVMYTADGLDWLLGLPATASASSFGKVASHFFFVGSDGRVYPTTSVAGPNPAALPGLTGLRAAASNNFGFAAAVGGASTIHTSTDGINWTGNLNPGGSTQLTTVTIEEPRLMLAGGASGVYYISRSGGATWEGPFTIPGAGNLVTAITRPGYPFL